jgi:hypothetical protein
MKFNKVNLTGRDVFYIILMAICFFCGFYLFDEGYSVGFMFGFILVCLAVEYHLVNIFRLLKKQFEKEKKEFDALSLVEAMMPLVAVGVLRSLIDKDKKKTIIKNPLKKKRGAKK